jgi:hypothetical protein
MTERRGSHTGSPAVVRRANNPGDGKTGCGRRMNSRLRQRDVALRRRVQAWARDVRFRGITKPSARKTSSFRGSARSVPSSTQNPWRDRGIDRPNYQTCCMSQSPGYSPRRRTSCISSGEFIRSPDGGRRALGTADGALPGRRPARSLDGGRRDPGTADGALLGRRPARFPGRRTARSLDGGRRAPWTADGAILGRRTARSLDGGPRAPWTAGGALPGRRPAQSGEAGRRAAVPINLIAPPATSLGHPAVRRRRGS